MRSGASLFEQEGHRSHELSSLLGPTPRPIVTWALDSRSYPHPRLASYNQPMTNRPHFFQAVIAVLWAFIGIRKGKNSLADQGIKPVHFIVAGVLATALFVLTLITTVRIIIQAAAA